MKIFRKILLILFFFYSFFNLYADGKKSLTITHIGETDTIQSIDVINTRKKGVLIDLNNVILYVYYTVSESTFDKIIVLIMNNKELFGGEEWNKENTRYLFDYGTFELFIENEGTEYYFYLIRRRQSSLFFNKLYKLIKTEESNNDLMVKLEQIFHYYGFYKDDKDD